MRRHVESCVNVVVTCMLSGHAPVYFTNRGRLLFCFCSSEMPSSIQCFLRLCRTQSNKLTKSFNSVNWRTMQLFVCRTASCAVYIIRSQCGSTFRGIFTTFAVRTLAGTKFGLVTTLGMSVTTDDRTQLVNLTLVDKTARPRHRNLIRRVKIPYLWL